MEANNNKAGGYKYALLKNQDQSSIPVAAAKGLPPAASKTPNQANQGMPAIQLGCCGSGEVQVENLLSVMQTQKKAKEEEFRRVQEEEEKLTSLLLEVQTRFPGKKMLLVDEGADLVQRPLLTSPTQAQEDQQVAPRQENGYHERPRWTPDNNWDQVDFVVKGEFAPFVCLRKDCPNRRQEFWGNIGQYRKKDCKGCTRVLVPIKPEDQVGYPLYVCPDDNCAYMWAYHGNEEGEKLRMKMGEAPVQNCPVCGVDSVTACRVGNDRLLAAWLVKGALNEWYTLTGHENKTSSYSDPSVFLESGKKVKVKVSRSD